MALIPGIQKQTYRKTDLMRASERQMDARIGIFGSFGGIECMSEPFDHMEYRSYLSTSAFAMQTASRTHVSESPTTHVGLSLILHINPTCRISVWAFIKRHLGVLPASIGYGGHLWGSMECPTSAGPRRVGFVCVAYATICGGSQCRIKCRISVWVPPMNKTKRRAVWGT